MDALHPIAQILVEIAGEVAALLQRSTLPRAARPEARRLLLQAWLAIDAQESPPESMLRDLSQTLDRLAAPPCPSVRDTIRLDPAMAFFDPDRLHTVQDSFIIPRLSRFDAFVEALARRTRIMVEHALAVEADITGKSVRPPKAKASADEGREELELVYSTVKARRK